jgi:hypothetical protein
MKKSLTILIAGPYRSGTNDDPTLMAQNLQRMEEACIAALFRAGHIPIIGEWFALPLLKQAGSKYAGDEIYEEISYPIARTANYPLRCYPPDRGRIKRRRWRCGVCLRIWGSRFIMI